MLLNKVKKIHHFELENKIVITLEVGVRNFEEMKENIEEVASEMFYSEDTCKLFINFSKAVFIIVNKKRDEMVIAKEFTIIPASK